ALATKLEGHPDNVAAALGGGLTLAWTDPSGPRSVRLDPHPAVQPVVCVPGGTVSTEAARGLLPDQVPHRDAVFNVARSGLLVAALTQQPALLFEATEDRLHQDYRAPASRATAKLLTRLRADGVPAVVSGSGPTVLALCVRPEDDRSGSFEQELRTVREAAGADWAVEPLAVDREGARTEVLPSPD
ncbi:MAG: homoserine kinase, partial [Nocardioidaceae bacterium]